MATIITSDVYSKLKAVHQKANDVYNYAVNNCEDFDFDNIWEQTYDIIFSEYISGFVFKSVKSFDYYDPDASYYDDVSAFITAFNELMENVHVI